jgi:dsDNA-specific endonuclease/ATPase MutS2
VDAFLDKMTAAGQPTAFLLSGHGTGVIKKVVQEHLKTCRYAGAREWGGGEGV